MRLYQEIEAYRPQNEQEAGDREAILAALRTYGPFLLERNCTLCHLTASGFIVSARGEQRRTLMVYHKIYRAWSWTGGHADGEADLLSVALREAEEETGLAGHPSAIPRNRVVGYPSGRRAPEERQLCGPSPAPECGLSAHGAGGRAAGRQRR